MQEEKSIVRKFTSAQSFLNACLDWLLEDEVANNSLLAAVQSIAAEEGELSGDHWFGAVEQRGQISGCAIHRHLDGLVTTNLPAGTHDQVVDSIVADGLTVRKVYGPEHDSACLARALCRIESCKWTVTHQWDCYATQDVHWPSPKASGQLRRPKSSEREVIATWAEQYAEEKPAPIPVRDFILKKMRDGDLFVWDDLGPKMMLSVSGRPPNSARISAAFTPNEFRGRGYASSAVAELTSQLLNQGHRYTTLVVETHEQHLHRMYSRLGFKKRDSRLNISIAGTRAARSASRQT